MTYELAKQLKDAGFPYRPKTDGESITFVYGELDFSKAEPDCGKIGEGYIIPTFSELIQACGETHFELERDWFNGRDKWRALMWKDGNVLSGFGSTLDEAVAKLWLALRSAETRNSAMDKSK